ncbi:hypothetical protein PYW08_008378 [Mythimna loreyi]|uniref:Uncharacterized protein n=1 Tax=Mythimna loreyi TaxID=667449 RepID=A0ACC2QB61_9NEOP|nr:hypothetical protein PYW08_008378 [Mythimna loreyi]
MLFSFVTVSCYFKTMSPTPDEGSLMAGQPDLILPDKLSDDSIVISGMSALLPRCRNLDEFNEKLYNMEDLVSSEGLRWDFKHPDLASGAGMAPELDLFDAQFFGVNYRLSDYMDPMSRKALEQAYQAIYDAGVSPSQLSGKKVAVFFGTSFSDTEKYGITEFIAKNGSGILGSSKTMFANRISYWLNVKGPSIGIDELDCSSTAALEAAYSVMRRGECEAAIVGGAYLGLHPHASVHHGRVSGTVAKDGKTKSFSQDADGYVLSDTVGIVFLQKAKDAKRVYAELLHVKTEFISVLRDEMGPKFGYSRDPQIMAGFIREFYEEVQVPPKVVEYVEAHGTGVPDSDKSELEALAEVYCRGRQDPLLVGSVTSNIGLTEAASGMAALTKVLLGYYTGKIAANLHCDNPRQDVVALREGRLCIVTEHQPFNRSYVALNGMSISGVNSHVLLHGRYKSKELSRYQASFPRLVTLSGRQESAITKVFEELKSRPIDAEELALLHNFHSSNISGHLSRGYTILDTDENQKTVSLCEKSEYFDEARRPLWFVYSGMGSQWAGMGAQLMRIPIFAAAIERCHQVLAPEGLDIVKIITSPDKEVLEDIRNCFVGIAAIQIGLTDILYELGLKPDGIIGHSVGEQGCAYADGCLSAEEMILCAFYRGQVSLTTPLIHGSMAAVGLGYEQISKMCPPEIDVACHNGPYSSTISGPADIMKAFVAELTAKGIFAKEVPTSNIAYHSRYISDAGPELLKLLQGVLKNPKPRSERWLSTSVPQNKWNKDMAKVCSAEYLTNNLLNPVLFEETSRLIPSNAVCVEIAPHGLLQAILKRSLPAEIRHIPLTNRSHPDPVLYLLQAVGDLYMQGYVPEVQALYPKVEFPVSTETPMLSHLVEWNHVETWNITSFIGGQKRTAASCQFVKSIHDDEYSYLRGHVVREMLCYPFAAALVSAWDTLAMYLEVAKRHEPVQFRDVHLYAQPTLHDQRPLRLSVTLHRGSGKFEILNENSRVASGYIRTAWNNVITKNNDTDMVLSSKDIYQLLEDRDYNYSGEFVSVEAANESLSQAALVWRDNWVTLIDGLLQMNMLRQAHDAVSLPTHIRRLDINPRKHLQDAYRLNGKPVLNAYFSYIHDLTTCGGVTLQNIKYRNLPPVAQDSNRVNLAVPPARGGSKSTGSVQQQVRLKKAVTLQCSQIGDLNSLHYVEAPPSQTTDWAVTVHYAGLCMPDVKRAIGVTPCDSKLYGMDYSGVTESGERVMGLVHSGAASSVVRAQPELLWPVPAHWSLEDAATVPLAYVHALYCLIIKGRMLRNNDVLVHGGTGALGQAAIAIALAYGCTVFTTVSDSRKKKFLQKLYPELKDKQIGISCDSSFLDNVLMATNGKGCEVILSGVKGQSKNAALKCLAFSGIFVDTVQLQDGEEYELGMFLMTKQRSYATTDLSSLFTQPRYEEMKCLQMMLTEGIVRGYVRPLSRVTYAPQDAPRAFQLLVNSRHRGRVLLRMQDTVSNLYSRIMCSPGESYLMFWDSGALGVQLTDQLVQRGAKNIYICCPSLNQYQHYKIRSWQKLGVKVITVEKNIYAKNTISAVINDATRLGIIAGICVTITNIFDDKHEKELSRFLNSLDSASRSLCRDLKYFTVVSTVTSVGQDTCVARAKCGFTATCVDLSGLNKASSHDVAEVVERALCSSSPVLLAQPAQIITPGMFKQIIELAGISEPQKISHDVTLQELGMADSKVPVVASFLNIAYNISLKPESISQLTLNKIHELVESGSDIIPDNISGLPLFFSTVAKDELLATIDMVVVPTLYKDIALSSDEFDVNRRYMCIVPGMEGHHERFHVLCERLKLPALVLQPGLDHPAETVQETAQRYAQILTNKLGIQNNFYLLGYETGVFVALELAAILEGHGLTGTVFCVGGSPDDLQETLEDQLRAYKTEEHLQDAITRHMSKLLIGENIPNFDDVLKDATTWSQKVDACVRALLGRLPYSVQYARGLIEAAMASIKRSRSYVAPALVLRSQLVLLRTSSANVTAPGPELQKYSQRPVAVHQLRTPLSFICYDMECQAIINRNLDTQIKSEFEMKNLCCAYNLSSYKK